MPKGCAHAYNVTALWQGQSFEPLLFIPHAVCINVEIFQMCSSALSRALCSRLTDLDSTSSLKHCHATPWLNSSEPGFIPFPIQNWLKAPFVISSNLCLKLLFPLWERCSPFVVHKLVLCTLTQCNFVSDASDGARNGLAGSVGFFPYDFLQL